MFRNMTVICGLVILVIALTPPAALLAYDGTEAGQQEWEETQQAIDYWAEELINAETEARRDFATEQMQQNMEHLEELKRRRRELCPGSGKTPLENGIIDLYHRQRGAREIFPSLAGEVGVETPPSMVSKPTGPVGAYGVFNMFRYMKPFLEAAEQMDGYRRGGTGQGEAFCDQPEQPLSTPEYSLGPLVPFQER